MQVEFGEPAAGTQRALKLEGALSKTKDLKQAVARTELHLKQVQASAAVESCGGKARCREAGAREGED